MGDFMVVQQEFDERFGRISPTKGSRTQQLKKELIKCSAPFSSRGALLNTIIGFLPILTWLPRYRWRTDLINDVIGGLTVGIMHVPQGKMLFQSFYFIQLITLHSLSFKLFHLLTERAR